MNYDIDTAEGMANAKTWTENHLSLLKDGGTWIVPRSASIYTINRTEKTVFCVSMFGGDGPTDKVLKELGWKVVYK